jgi:predicted porin
MKKHLIAAAVAGALAVPAMAQVSISGYIESGITSKQVEKTGAAGTLVRQTQYASDPFGTSNITFKGSEDLGGGLKASFQITEEFDTADSKHDDDFEQAWVQLSGGFGSIRLGTQSDPAQEAGARYRFFGDPGRVSMRDGSNEDQAISYTTPKIGGFSATVFLLDAGKSGADADQDKRQSYFVGGDLGALKLGIGYQKFTGTEKTDDVFQGISLSYNLGMATIGAAYLTQKDESVDETTKVTALHIMMPVSDALKVGLAVNQGRDDDNTATQTVLAATYALSKRTSLNFAYESAKADDDGAVNNFTATNGIQNAFVTGETTSGYALSVSHKF